MRDNDIYRFLVAELWSLHFFKIKKGNTALPPAIEFTVACMLDKPRKFRAVSIFKVPHARLDMSTIQTAAGDSIVLSPLVHCEVDTSFHQPIDITLDRRLYSFLTDMVKRFESNGGATMAEKNLVSPSSSRAPSPVRHRGTSADHRGQERRASVDSVRIRRTASAAAVKAGPGGKKHNKRDYRCLFFKLEPQIDVLQEVTPDVVTILGWLGIQKRETIIAALHEGVIDTLEGLLMALSALFARH